MCSCHIVIFLQVLGMLLVACIRGEDGAVVDGSVNSGGADTVKVAWAGMVSDMIHGKSVLALGSL